jgi:hypothetical protein
MAWIVRHRQTKEPETDRPSLNHRATSRLYRLPFALIDRPPSEAGPGLKGEEIPRLCRGGSSSLTFPGVDMGLRRTHMHENHFEPVRCRIGCAWDGKGCMDSGDVETVREFDLEGAF